LCDFWGRFLNISGAASGYNNRLNENQTAKPIQMSKNDYIRGINTVTPNQIHYGKSETKNSRCLFHDRGQPPRRLRWMLLNIDIIDPVHHKHHPVPSITLLSLILTCSESLTTGKSGYRSGYERSQQDFGFYFDTSEDGAFMSNNSSKSMEQRMKIICLSR
jgi:hypothetical protein